MFFSLKSRTSGAAGKWIRCFLSVISCFSSRTGEKFFCSAKVQGNGDGGREAYEYEYYNETIVRKTAYTAFKLAKSRKNKVTNLDKSNVLGSSRLWRQTVQQAAEDFPDVELEHLYIDNAAMELIRNPGRFDVFVTSNLFE